MTDNPNDSRHDNRNDIKTDEPPPRKKNGLMKLSIAAVLAAVSVAYAAHQVQESMNSTHEFGGRGRAGSRRNVIDTEDGRQLLWAKGPRDLESGEWFDMTDSPIDPKKFNHGIGKDKIPAIDNPEFVPISDTDRLAGRNVIDATIVIGYVSDGEARAYPVNIMNQHELVNDVIGGTPLTVAW